MSDEQQHSNFDLPTTGLLLDSATKMTATTSMTTTTIHEKDYPPPAYSQLTSPCLPPKSTHHQPYPPEPPPPFDSLPPYPAGPNISKIKYPKVRTGPRYSCPHCEGQFLFHHAQGLAYCPFCYKEISIGKYIKFRTTVYIVFGMMFLLSSISSATVLLALHMKEAYYLCPAVTMAIIGLALLFRSSYVSSCYKEAKRLNYD